MSEGSYSSIVIVMSTGMSKKDADDNTILALVKRDRNCQTESRPLQQLLLPKNFA